MTIAQLINEPESKTLEFKREMSSPRPLLKTLVAFANAAGGRLVLGVTDDRQVIGIESKSGAFKRSLKELREDALIEFTLPDKPDSRLQKYRLTERGRSFLTTEHTAGTEKGNHR